MPLPTSGKINISDILREMGKPTNTKVDLNSLASQWYAQTNKAKFNGTVHNLSDWYGEKWAIADTLSVSPNNYRVGSSGGIVIINITSNTGWSVRNLIGSGVSINLQDSQGLGNGTVRLSFSRNSRTSTRIGELEIKTLNNRISTSFTWSQSGGSTGGGGGDGDPIIAIQ